MRRGYVSSPASIYSGIHKLAPGTFLKMTGSARDPSIKTYWDARAMARAGVSNQFSGSPEQAVQQTDALLRQSITGQMVADVPLGAFLSGGVDSSTVVALMQAMSLRPIKTFSIGFRETGYDEAQYAKAVARHIGTDHTELYVSMNEAMAVIPRLGAIYCEPFADSSQIPTFLVSQLARGKVTVSLSGDGGDELFCGYNRYRLADGLWSKLSRLPKPARRTMAAVIRSLSPRQWDNVARLPSALLPQRMQPRLVGDKLHKAAGVIGHDCVAEIYEALTSHWHEPSDVVIGGPESAALRTCSLDDLGDGARAMMFQDLIGYLPDDILTKVDRASMAVSLEARVPMLDRRLVEFSWTLPASILNRDGQSKWPLRQVLYRHVPRNLIERPKAGFADR